MNFPRYLFIFEKGGICMSNYECPQCYGPENSRIRQKISRLDRLTGELVTAFIGGVFVLTPKNKPSFAVYRRNLC